MEQGFVAHLIELRKRLIWSAIGFSLIFLSLFHWANYFYQLLAAPVGKFLPASTQLIASDITSPFLVPLKLVALLAFVLSLPNTLYQIWLFVSPALYRQEKQLIFWVISSAFSLFLFGMAFCYCLVLPAIFHFVSQFKSSQITMLTDIDKYLSFVLSLFMVFGLAFETPVIVFLLIRFEILTSSKARQIRPYIFIGCFILAAVVTPPDVFSQTMLALPLYALYELGILLAQLLVKPRN